MLPLFVSVPAGNFMSDFLETIKKKYIVVLDVHTENGYADWHIDSATSVVWG